LPHHSEIKPKKRLTKCLIVFHTSVGGAGGRWLSNALDIGQIEQVTLVDIGLKVRIGIHGMERYITKVDSNITEAVRQTLASLNYMSRRSFKPNCTHRNIGTFCVYKHQQI
jgi:hypothetical protein